jgi:hypothetical protein
MRLPIQIAALQRSLTANQRRIVVAAILGDMLEFFDYFLIGFVLAFIVGSWPPEARPQRLYLRGDGGLLTDGPGGPPRHYRYDSRRPIPTAGGRNVLIDGPHDQRSVQGLPDYA